MYEIRKDDGNFELCRENIMFAEHNKIAIMIFVDRVEETSRIEGALAGDKPALVVVYGRRRLGKSTLIKRVLSDNDVIFLLTDRRDSIRERCWRKWLLRYSLISIN